MKSYLKIIVLTMIFMCILICNTVFADINDDDFFTDLPESHWVYNAVKEMKRLYYRWISRWDI